MTFEIIIAIGFVAVLVLVLIVGLVLAFHAGKDSAVKKDAQDATHKLEHHLDPLATDAEYLSRLRRAQKRLARLRDRATKR